jgi:hypothetical protein
MSIFYISVLGNKLVSKWRNIKDNFTRSLRKKKSGQGADSGRQYVYARQLSFLLSTTAPATTQSSIEEEGQLEVSDETPETQTAPEKRRKTTRVSGRQRLEDSLVKFMNTPVPVESKKISNPNSAFFESLQPALDSFTIDEQLEFQTEVLNNVKRIRARSTGIPHYSSHYRYQPPSDPRYPNVPNSFPQMQQYSPFP